jgi:hypothetical protein
MRSGTEGAEPALHFRQAPGFRALKPVSNLRCALCFVVRFRILLAAGGLALVCSGCNKDNEQIKVYRLAKAPLESPPSEANPAGPANDASLAMPGAEAPLSLAPSADTPPNWEAQPPSQMRQASFLRRGENGAVADISLVILGGAAGNVLDNVNRWLSQLGQPPVSAEQLTGIVQRLPTARGDVSVVDLVGKPENGDANKDGRIIAAMILQEGKTSFFKMRGNAALTEAEKSNFLKWVSAMCGAGPAMEAANPAAPSSPAAPQLKWEAPEGWATAAPSAMRYASFTAAAEDGQTADISIVTFPGDGGGDTDNINRWRKQIGLPPMEAGHPGSVVPMKIGPSTFSTIDMSGTKSRVVTAWVRRDGRTWFFKLTGPDKVVEKEKPKFVKFLQSVRF